MQLTTCVAFCDTCRNPSTSPGGRGRCSSQTGMGTFCASGDRATVGTVKAGKNTAGARRSTKRAKNTATRRKDTIRWRSRTYTLATFLKEEGRRKKEKAAVTVPSVAFEESAGRVLAIRQAFDWRTRNLSRAFPEQGALFRPAPIVVIIRGWQAIGSGASSEGIRAMPVAGPAPSGDFWFLLVASKGTRRRQGIWGVGFLLFYI